MYMCGQKKYIYISRGGYYIYFYIYDWRYYIYIYAPEILYIYIYIYAAGERNKSKEREGKIKYIYIYKTWNSEDIIYMYMDEGKLTESCEENNNSKALEIGRECSE